MRENLPIIIHHRMLGRSRKTLLDLAENWGMSGTNVKLVSENAGSKLEPDIMNTRLLKVLQREMIKADNTSWTSITLHQFQGSLDWVLNF